MPFLLKDILPQSLFGRSLMILILPVLIIQIFTTYQFFERHWDKITERLAGALAGEIAIIVDRYEADPDSESVQYIRDIAAQKLQIRVRYVPDTRIVNVQQKYRFWEHIMVQGLSKALEERVQRPYSLYVSLQDEMVQIDVQLEGGVLKIDVPHKRIFSSSAYTFLLWMVASSILMLVIAILFMRNQIRPIRKLSVAAERFGKGRNVPFLKPSGAREVRAATHSFLKMRERLDRQMNQRTSMLAGVSHDLRTPLTRIKLQLAMLPESEDVSALQKDVEEMEAMINAYLDFARGEGDENLEWVVVDEFIQNIVRTSWRDKRENIHTDLENNIRIMVRPVAMTRCLNNLIGNALSYGQNVYIALKLEDEEMLQLVIEDDGPGAKPEQYDDLFKPFFRGETSRNKKTGGIGLGLPIAQDIVHGHGGEISLGKSRYGGLRVEIKLPF